MKKCGLCFVFDIAPVSVSGVIGDVVNDSRCSLREIELKYILSRELWYEHLPVSVPVSDVIIDW